MAGSGGCRVIVGRRAVCARPSDVLHAASYNRGWLQGALWPGSGHGLPERVKCIRVSSYSHAELRTTSLCLRGKRVCPFIVLEGLYRAQERQSWSASGVLRCTRFIKVEGEDDTDSRILISCGGFAVSRCG